MPLTFSFIVCCLHFTMSNPPKKHMDCYHFNRRRSKKGAEMPAPRQVMGSVPQNPVYDATVYPLLEDMETVVVSCPLESVHLGAEGEIYTEALPPTS